MIKDADGAHPSTDEEEYEEEYEYEEVQEDNLQEVEEIVEEQVLFSFRPYNCFSFISPSKAFKFIHQSEIKTLFHSFVSNVQAFTNESYDNVILMCLQCRFDYSVIHFIHILFKLFFCITVGIMTNCFHYMQKTQLNYLYHLGSINLHQNLAVEL